MQLPAPELGQVLDVAWAPNVGRRFHYIAAAEEQALKIYRLSRDTVSSSNDNNNSSSGNNNNRKDKKKQQQRPVKDGNNSSAATTTTSTMKLEHTQTIRENTWRCQWNVTGTVLAGAGDGGVVNLYKADSNRIFHRVSYVQGDVAPGSTSAINNNDMIEHP